MDTRKIDEKLKAASPASIDDNSEKQPLISDENNNDTGLSTGDCIAFTAGTLLLGIGWAAPNIAIQVLYGSWLTRGLSMVCLPLSTYGCGRLGGSIGYSLKKEIEGSCCNPGNDHATPPEQLRTYGLSGMRM